MLSVRGLQPDFHVKLAHGCVKRASAIGKAGKTKSNVARSQFSTVAVIVEGASPQRPSLQCLPHFPGFEL